MKSEHQHLAQLLRTTKALDGFTLVIVLTPKICPRLQKRAVTHHQIFGAVAALVLRLFGLCHSVLLIQLHAFTSHALTEGCCSPEAWGGCREQADRICSRVTRITEIHSHRHVDFLCYHFVENGRSKLFPSKAVVLGWCYRFWFLYHTTSLPAS